MSYTVYGIDVYVDEFPTTVESVISQVTDDFRRLSGFVSVEVAQLVGPGGGNPCVNATFADRDSAIKAMTDFCSFDVDEAMECYIDPSDKQNS